MVDLPVAKQHTIKSFITELIERDANVRVTVQTEVGGGYSEVNYDADTDVEILLLTVNSRERQDRSANYSNTVTHECYLAEHAEFLMGRKIIVTATKDEYGEWQDAETVDEYLILGGARQHGVMAPRDHIRYDLCRLTRGV